MKMTIIKNLTKFKFRKFFVSIKIKKFSTKNEIDIGGRIDTNLHKSEQVTPWSVEGKVDYEKLVKQFGTELIDENLMQRFEETVGEVHPWMKRGIFFTHRGLKTFLNSVERRDPVFLYTGRGPTSNSMHLGHLVPFIFTKWLQDKLSCPLVIQISDDEKCAIKQKKFEEIYRYGIENIKDIIACGFDNKKTFIFSNREYRLRCKSFELLATEMKNLTSLKEIKKIFGFNEDNTIAMYDWPFYQTAAAYYTSYPHIFNNRSALCLIPHAIDQDPYFRLSRDLSPRLNLPKPCNIMSRFVPPLSGFEGKMSSSTNQEGTIFLSDSEKTIKNKVMKYAFSGSKGDGSLADHRKYGGDPDRDIAFQYLRYLELDDIKLENIREAFVKGEISCGEMKILLLDKLIPLISEVQDKRSKITQSIFEEFLLEKPMSISDLNANEDKINRILYKNEHRLYALLDEHKINYQTKYHDDLNLIIQDKEKEYEWKTSVPGTVCKTALLKSQKNEYILFIYNYEIVLNLKEIKKRLKLNRLVYAEKDTVEFLFCQNDSIKYDESSQHNKKESSVLSLFSLINFKGDKQTTHSIKIFLQNELNNSNFLNFQPFRNDATTSISLSDSLELIRKLGYDFQFLDI